METRSAVLNAAFRRSGDALLAAIEPSDRPATRTRTERGLGRRCGPAFPGSSSPELPQARLSSHAAGQRYGSGSRRATASLSAVLNGGTGLRVAVRRRVRGYGGGARQAASRSPLNSTGDGLMVYRKGEASAQTSDLRVVRPWCLARPAGQRGRPRARAPGRGRAKVGGCQCGPCACPADRRVARCRRSPAFLVQSGQADGQRHGR